MTIQYEARPGQPVTQRETDIVRGMADGRSNAEIGKSLFISEDTVKTHARRLFRKLGARDRAHAVALAYRCGILDPTLDLHPTLDLTPDARIQQARCLLTRWEAIWEHLPPIHPLHRFRTELAGILDDDAAHRETA